MGCEPAIAGCIPRGGGLPRDRQPPPPRPHGVPKALHAREGPDPRHDPSPLKGDLLSRQWFAPGRCRGPGAGVWFRLAYYTPYCAVSFAIFQSLLNVEVTAPSPSSSPPEPLPDTS